MKTQRNSVTGLFRRLPVKHTYKRRKERGLDASDQALIMKVQTRMHDLAFIQVYNLVACTLILERLNLLLNQPHHPLREFLDQELRKTYLSFIRNCYEFAILDAVDNAVGDIPRHEWGTPCHRRPFQYKRLHHFDNDDQCRNTTNFSRGDIQRMLNCFGLPELIRTHHRYAYHPEEILIYFLVKMAKGLPHFTIAMTLGGCEIRQGEGYNWMVAYLDDRYDRVIGPSALELWGPKFPVFAETIRSKLGQGRWWQNEENNEFEYEEGRFYPEGTFKIVGFIDMKCFKGTRTGSGPNLDPHIRRRPNWYLKQRAVYSGYKKFHGTSILSVTLPNGLVGGVFGPISCRRHDRTAMVWSRIDEILANFQEQELGLQGEERFCIYGDAAYAGNYQCVRCPHRAGAGGEAALTLDQQDENRVMRKARIAVEWSYGETTRLCPEADHWKQRKIDSRGRTFFAETRLFFLLTNIYNCVHGANASKYFDLSPPRMEDYLNGQF